MFAAAEIYIEGAGDFLKKDVKKAVKWYFKAANAGYKKAFFVIGSFYEQGINYLPQDKKKALEWFKKTDTDDLFYKIGDFYYENDRKYGFKDAKKIALTYYKKAAQKGNIDAPYKIGDLYNYSFYDKDKNMKEALKWYKKAADAGNKTAMHTMGEYYVQDKTRGKLLYFYGEKDLQKGLEYFEKSCKAGNIKSMLILGFYYEYGDAGFVKDEKKSLEYYKKALETEPSNEEALYAMGRFYEHGKGGLSQDENKAMEYYEKAVTN